ncbi:GtrA family protein [Croceibacterium sp. TMG7-5b_MA50]|uniref:GtrA family protein n=1 Tax=Croceibacterium sp. TMG7-5b_MA50 TaxID=3121290 RepID=UPI003221DCE2
MLTRTATPERPPMRVHAFALISGIGWLVDFTLFNLLAVAGVDLFVANLVGAGVAVSLVFVAGRHFIFRDSRTPLPLAIAAYVCWNVVAILLASVAVAAIGRLLASPAVIMPTENLLSSLGVTLNALYLVPPIAKVAVTPATMYLNYLAMGIIIEQRIRFW